MSQVVFKRALEGCVPSVIPVDLDKADEYAPGNVFIRSKKPRKMIPMRGQDLTNTGELMRNILAKDSEISISLSKKVILDRSIAPLHVSVEVSGDAELEIALSAIAGLEDLKLSSHDKKILHIRADFGEVIEMSTNLVRANREGGFKVDTDLPVVKQAMEHGGVLFITTTLYKAECCKVAVKLSNKKGDKQQRKYTEVISIDKPVTLAYLLLKAKIDSGGLVKPELNTRLIKKAPQPTEIRQKLTSSKDSTDGARGRRRSSVFEGMPDDDFLYNLKDFQPFESSTYVGILEEAKNWVAPLLSNAELQEAFLIYTKPPLTYERLNELSSYFLDLGNALRCHQRAPQNILKDIEPIMDALSSDLDTKLDEITSVIIVAEAGDEFPQHIVQSIIELPPDKRKLLMDVILSTPYGSSRHVYVGEGPYRDPELRPIMSRMGFSVPPDTGGNLLRVRKDSEDEEDMLAAAIILMLASEKK